MAFDPRIHHRRSIRLKGYDYSREGAYFITICCENMKNRFGYIENQEMILNEMGVIAYNEWVALSGRFSNIELDVFQIMPNHMHGIIVIVPVGATLAVAQNDTVGTGCDNYIEMGTGASPVPTSGRTVTVGDIVGAYKSLVSNECLKIFKIKNKTMGKLWQRNYYEIIIRNDQSYQRISDYIVNNPAKWKQDKFHEK
ncbi:transposase [Dyadobacter sp. CY312]|uniref:transposase n=1 Tax=Dyadobacter sp. CY312 TaxID=2907303 RepID=UPI001F35967C|nr:transposase [Dyadobacter sp. CY312]MCE7042457.1 hypothetical protein [Dyadobacter sp. CY312]